LLVRPGCHGVLAVKGCALRAGGFAVFDP